MEGVHERGAEPGISLGWLCSLDDN